MSNANINDICYVDRGLYRQIIMELSNCQFVDANANVIFHGFTGTGKSYLACVLGKQACMHARDSHLIHTHT